MNLVEQLTAVRAMKIALAEIEAGLQAGVMKLADQTGATTFKPSLGRVNVVTREPKPLILQDELLAWCKQHRPDEVISIEQVRPSFMAAVEAELAVNGDTVVNTTTGEIVTWARPSASSRYVSMTIPPSVKASAVAQVTDRLPEILTAGQFMIEAAS